MTSRREFLQATAVLSAVPLTVSASIVADTPLVLSSVVIDERYAAARVFGTRAQRSGIALSPIKGDITDLWLDELRPLWSGRQAAIAGLTARPALFCLEQLAWDHRMRVVYHAEHKPRPDGTMAHTVHLAALGLGSAELAAAGAAWPGYAAGAMSRLSATRSACGPSTACMEGAIGDDAVTLHSWVISA
jgi:hypothetical protein